MIEQLPYCGTAPHPGELLSRFNLDPILIGALLLLAVSHALVARNQRQRALALGGWMVASAAFISPLCALSVSLFSARITQHMILLLIAAPLLALAWPRYQRGQRGWMPWVCAAAFFVSLWFWHMPIPYEATFGSTAIYWAMHVTLFGSSVLLWRALLQHRPAHAADALAVGIVSSMQMSLLGAVLTFAARPLFFPHLTTTAAWGLTPLQDQQLGGVLMWIPGMSLFLWVAVRSLKKAWKSLAGPEPA